MKFVLFSFLLLVSCAQLKSKSYSESTDQYWSELVASSLANKTSFLTTLKNTNPHLYNQIENDSKDLKLISFWGQSYNFDSGAKKQIIDDKIINELQAKFNISNDNKIVHAGITHTYGYLFSVLNTPYGYKRKRWIDPTLNFAFAFSGNSLGPQTTEGGMFSNITYFAGSIAFKEIKDRKDLQALQNVSSEVKKFDYSKLEIQKVEEEIIQNGVHGNILRTTLVKFPFKSEKEENDYLLIYSIWKPKLHKEILITAFPIKKDAYKKLVDEESLGANKGISVRYNAYLEGHMEQNLTGIKRLY